MRRPQPATWTDTRVGDGRWAIRRYTNGTLAQRCVVCDDDGTREFRRFRWVLVSADTVVCGRCRFPVDQADLGRPTVLPTSPDLEEGLW
jgi:hypothetical protein